jgi:rubrerythrin
MPLFPKRARSPGQSPRKQRKDECRASQPVHEASFPAWAFYDERRRRRNAARCTVRVSATIADPPGDDDDDGEDSGLPPVLPPDAFKRPAGGPASQVAKYRPLRLSEILGQPDVTVALEAFAKDPFPTAMLFHGESGTGKTSTALALARPLRCSLDDAEMGGVFEIASGEMTADQVRDKLNLPRYRALCCSPSTWASAKPASSDYSFASEREKRKSRRITATQERITSDIRFYGGNEMHVCNECLPRMARYIQSCLTWVNGQCQKCRRLALVTVVSAGSLCPLMHSQPHTPEPETVRLGIFERVVTAGTTSSGSGSGAAALFREASDHLKYNERVTVQIQRSCATCGQVFLARNGEFTCPFCSAEA